ncbi:hypothetical protein BGZ54_008926 [Gamsiella multidivaricata]|nr:hypothetical protein BGZ54_008926 [Gamsiella multidivaricata]
MGGFFTRAPSTPSPTDVPQDDNDDRNSISVRPAPVPAKALSTPFPTQWPATGADDSTATSKLGTSDNAGARDHISSQSSATATSSSPRLEQNPLPHLPFVPSPEHNPDLKWAPRFRADPSSILLAYPRTNVDHIHDFYQIYNPPEKGWWNVASTMVMCGVAAVSKTFMTFGAYTGVYNMNPFLKVLYDPHRTRPILTITNHASTPVGAFFRFGQIVPIIRGNGIYQPAVDKSIDLLKSGRWVHIFPEGKINQSDQLIRLKWGVGRILMEYGGPPIADGGKPMSEAEIPIVIPIYHLGMEDILRLYPNNDSPIFPKLGLPLTIVFGEPIDFGTLMQEYKEGKIQEVEARVKITERVYEALDELKRVALRLQKEHADEIEKDRIKKGRWWWIKPAGWGWWRSPDMELYPQHRDATVKIEEI